MGIRYHPSHLAWVLLVVNDVQMYDIIALENLCFRPSTRTQKARVLKNLHSGERF